MALNKICRGLEKNDPMAPLEACPLAERKISVGMLTTVEGTSVNCCVPEGLTSIWGKHWMWQMTGHVQQILSTLYSMYVFASSYALSQRKPFTPRSYVVWVDLWLVIYVWVSTKPSSLKQSDFKTQLRKYRNQELKLLDFCLFWYQSIIPTDGPYSRKFRKQETLGGDLQKNP